MLYLLLFFLALSSCGIKANPKPLPEPSVEIRRIGERLYVRSLQGDVQVEGFEKLDGWFVKESRHALCFQVRRIGGKSAKFCAGKPVESKPTVKLKEDTQSVLVIASGFPSYRLYALSEGRLNLPQVAQFKEEYRINKDYFERCYALTGRVDIRESEPYTFCVRAKEAPPLKDVERLEYQVVEGKIYLFWSYTPDELFKEFVIYRNGKQVGSTSSYIYEDTLPEKETTYTVKVRNKLNLESGGVSITYSP
ncbi:conserved hypothetical protein [Hydrogenobacter thermophilus TK-6]|uniref:Fibronectin type-III domain-containing protein n=1 Tax=Hydrogenobacter thermophilus (strain DSM 6534 / IAM 12695 / TK-6) TaxID=608538 RepID=D3DJP3_HYDTT|nr:hypothetical protein [Hydrogenobacter thermophilus]ADO45968.1 conserved hypothetical protein [Hydrogenobacter thermophilus TK-6]BAI70045.1 hypothetical protein HTH_1597 [Hydrogenobacter thermophilus TK-6]